MALALCGSLLIALAGLHSQTAFGARTTEPTGPAAVLAAETTPTPIGTATSSPALATAIPGYRTPLPDPTTGAGASTGAASGSDTPVGSAETALGAVVMLVLIVGVLAVGLGASSRVKRP